MSYEAIANGFDVEARRWQLAMVKEKGIHTHEIRDMQWRSGSVCCLSVRQVRMRMLRKEKVDCNNLRPEGRAMVRRLNLSSMSGKRVHKQKETEAQIPLDEARPEGFYTRVQGR